MLDKRSIGVIYAIKQGEGTNQKRIASFMSKYTDTPVEHYTQENLTSILTCAISDLLNNMEHPGSYFYEFMRWKNDPWNMNDFDAMCAALSTVQVKRLNYNTNKYEYINGFRAIEEFNVND